MDDRPQVLIDWLVLAKKCESFTSAELEHVINEAARSALSDRRPISEKDIIAALDSNPPAFRASEDSGR
jgi:ATP-dependent 26S proteasome regulatory subunit